MSQATGENQPPEQLARKPVPTGLDELARAVSLCSSALLVVTAILCTVGVVFTLSKPAMVFDSWKTWLPIGVIYAGMGVEFLRMKKTCRLFVITRFVLPLFVVPVAAFMVALHSHWWSEGDLQAMFAWTGVMVVWATGFFFGMASVVVAVRKSFQTVGLKDGKAPDTPQEARIYKFQSSDDSEQAQCM